MGKEGMGEGRWGEARGGNWRYAGVASTSLGVIIGPVCSNNWRGRKLWTYGATVWITTYRWRQRPVDSRSHCILLQLEQQTLWVACRHWTAKHINSDPNGASDVHKMWPLQLLLQIMNVNCCHFTVITELLYSISRCTQGVIYLS